MNSRSPRPPSPGGMSAASNMSRVSTISKPTISALHKKKDTVSIVGGSPRVKGLTSAALSSIPEGPSAIETMTVEACLEFVSAPHHTWDSASKEMARMATKANLTAAALATKGGGYFGGQDDTASLKSGMSSVSAYSIAKSTTSTVRKGVPAKGHMAMLPLSGHANSTIGQPKEVPDMLVQGSGGFTFVTQSRAGSSHSTANIPSSRAGLNTGARKPSPPPVAGAPLLSSATPQMRIGDYDAEEENDNRSTKSLQRTGSFAGAAGGISGIRNSRPNPNSAPAPGRSSLHSSQAPSLAPNRIATKAPLEAKRKQNTGTPTQPKNDDLNNLLVIGGVKK